VPALVNEQHEHDYRGELPGEHVGVRRHRCTRETHLADLQALDELRQHRHDLRPHLGGKDNNPGFAFHSLSFSQGTV